MATKVRFAGESSSVGAPYPKALLPVEADAGRHYFVAEGTLAYTLGVRHDQKAGKLGEPNMITRALLTALAAVLLTGAAQAGDSDSAQKTRTLVAMLQSLTIREVPDEKLSAALNAELTRARPEPQGQLLPALATGADAGAPRTALEKIAAPVANADLRERELRVAETIRAPAAAVSLFDGASLAGWEGNTNVWRVRDKAIVGGSMNGNPQNEFLATLRSYTNFVLRLEYRLAGTEGFINSGVQFRSVRVSHPPNEMKGYQADIGAGHSGCLYDESRRNKFLARASDDTIKRLEKAGEWNRYELRCEGRRIEIRLNGEQTVNYTEADLTIPQEGLIGLQIHGGSKAEVFFRNITIQEP
jgi:hypothetical protein